jgi:thioredoxin 1
MQKIKSNEFEDKLKSAQFVIMDFSSPGCAPCKKVPGLLEEVMAELNGVNIAAFEADVTENVEIAQKFMILGVPTIIIFKEGKEIQRFNSVPKKDKIKSCFH